MVIKLSVIHAIVVLLILSVNGSDKNRPFVKEFHSLENRTDFLILIEKSGSVFADVVEIADDKKMSLINTTVSREECRKCLFTKYEVKQNRENTKTNCRFENGDMIKHKTTGYWNYFTDCNLPRMSESIDNRTADMILFNINNYCIDPPDLETFWAKLNPQGVIIGYHTVFHKRRSEQNVTEMEPNSMISCYYHFLKKVHDFSKRNGLHLVHSSLNHNYWLLHQPHQNTTSTESLSESTENPISLINTTNSSAKHLILNTISITTSASSDGTVYKVPNIVHVVNVNEGDLKLYAFLHILSAMSNIHNSTLYFHTTHIPTGEYFQMLVATNRMEVHMIKQPVEIFGQRPTIKFHISDIVRLEALKQYGGIYIDLDVVVFRSFDAFRNNDMTMAKYMTKGTNLCNAIMISVPHAKFIERWYDTYIGVDFTCLYCFDIELPGKLARYYPDTINVLHMNSFYVLGEDYFFLNQPSYHTQRDPYSMYAQHIWGNLNTPNLEKKTVDYFCNSKQGYADMVRFSLRNTNVKDIYCELNSLWMTEK